MAGLGVWLHTTLEDGQNVKGDRDSITAERDTL